jgi:hypothetical protein
MPTDRPTNRPKMLFAFTVHGLPCVVQITPTLRLGYLCGYVGLPTGHKLYGRTFGDPETDALRVHGGITYGAAHLPCQPSTLPPTWWLGFDCSHADDIPHYGGVAKDQAFVEAELTNLARQLRTGP